MTVTDWNHLMTQTPTCLHLPMPFTSPHRSSRCQTQCYSTLCKWETNCHQAIKADPKFQLKMQEDLKRSYVWHHSARVMLTSNLRVDVILWSHGNHHSYLLWQWWSTYLIFQLLSWFVSTSALAPVCMTATFPSPPTAAHGLLQEPVVHVCSSLSNWPGLLPFTG